MKTENRFMTGRKLLIVAGIMAVQSCASVSQPTQRELAGMESMPLELIHDRIQRESERLLERQDVLQAQLSNVQVIEHPEVPPEPEYDPLDDILVSIDVNNEDVQNVLRALADQAGMNLLLDPELANLNRRISMSLRDVPASLVFNRIMELLDLYGDVQRNVLVVRPFQEVVFNLDFLSDLTTMDFNIGGDVFGANVGATGGGGGGLGGGSGGAGAGGGGQSGMTGSLSLVGVNGERRDAYGQLDAMLQDLIGRRASGANGEMLLPGIGMPDERATLDQISLAANPVYSLNSMTGTLYLRARPSQVRNVTDLIDRYKSILERQVLIEAQILDVSLSEQFSFGIDWGLLRSGILAGYGGSSMTMDGFTSTLPDAASQERTITIPGMSTATESSLGALYSSMTFSAALNMLNNFGTVRVLSNPTIRAINSRPAFISVGRNSRYIAESTAVTTAVGGGDSTTSTSVTTSSVFNGVMLGVQPFISENGKISLTIHPMQSEVQEDSLRLIDVGGNSRVSLPVIDFKGLTTSLSMNSGDTIILGGLIDEVGGTGGDGVPGLRDVPYIGPLFGSTSRSTRVRELVIVLRVTVL